MAKRRKKVRSFLIPAVITYAAFALLFSVALKDRLDQAVISLILMCIVPVVIIAWIIDAIRHGEMTRQGHRSLISSTFNTRRITRKDAPFQFWSMIILMIVFALAILIFAVLGIYARLTLASPISSL